MQVYEQITPAEQEREKEKEEQAMPRAAPSGGSRLTLLQAAVCALILLAALALAIYPIKSVRALEKSGAGERSAS